MTNVLHEQNHMTKPFRFLRPIVVSHGLQNMFPDNVATSLCTLSSFTNASHIHYIYNHENNHNIEHYKPYEGSTYLFLFVRCKSLLTKVVSRNCQFCLLWYTNHAFSSS